MWMIKYAILCVSSSGESYEQWWAVDLGEFNDKCITRVVIRNRADADRKYPCKNTVCANI